MKTPIFNFYLHEFLSFFKKKNKIKGSRDSYFNFDAIEYYFRNKKDGTASYNNVNNKTVNDIDFYDVFKYLDKTKSKVGQQYFLISYLPLMQIKTLRNKRYGYNIYSIIQKTENK